MKFKINSKKAMIFEVLLLIGMVIVLTFTLVNLENKKEALTNEGFIGGKHFDIISKYYEAENINLYIEQSAKLASKKSYYELTKKGGFDIEKCSAYKKFPIWQNKIIECYPDYKNNYNEYLNLNLNYYLSNYPGDNLKHLKDSFEFSIINNQLISYSLKELEFEIKNKSNQPIGVYSIKPGFNINLDYDFKNFKETIEDSKYLFDLCNSSKIKDIKKCAENNTKLDKSNLIIKQEQEYLLFNYNTNKKFPIIENNKLVNKDIIIYYALKFS